MSRSWLTRSSFRRGCSTSTRRFPSTSSRLVHKDNRTRNINKKATLVLRRLPLIQSKHLPEHTHPYRYVDKPSRHIPTRRPASTTMATSTKSHRILLTSLSASRSSSRCASSSRSSTPRGARDFRLQYAKDSKGHDFSPSYPHHSSTSSPSNSLSEWTSDSNGSSIPPSSRDALRLRYAKDSKGHDFSDTYPARFGSITPEDEVVLLESARSAVAKGVPRGARDWKLVNRYAKDGKGVDFWGMYRY